MVFVKNSLLNFTFFTYSLHILNTFSKYTDTIKKIKQFFLKVYFNCQGINKEFEFYGFNIDVGGIKYRIHS